MNSYLTSAALTSLLNEQVTPVRELPMPVLEASRAELVFQGIAPSVS